MRTTFDVRRTLPATSQLTEQVRELKKKLRTLGDVTVEHSNDFPLTQLAKCYGEAQAAADNLETALCRCESALHLAATHPTKPYEGRAAS